MIFMGTGWIVTSNHIKHWTETNKHQAEDLLPKLVSRLIRASCKPDHLYFPFGDSTSIGGFDGTLNVSESNEFIPLGFSVWEFGTDKSINQKFNEDYLKRTKDPKGINPSETTFVFVTSRPWTGKNEKCAEKNEEGIWKQVKGINANDLENWLHQCPAVHRWFASLIGNRTEDVWDIEQAWGSWRYGTSTPATYELIFNGRAEQSESLSKALKGNSKIIRVKSYSELEAYAFVLATLMQDEDLASRLLIVRDRSSWDILLDTQNSLILIPRGFTPENIGYAKQKGHLVIIPGSSNISESSSQCEIYLDKMSRDNRISALQSMGVRKDQAEQIYSDTHGELGPIRRHKILGPNESTIPQWVNDFDLNIVIAALMATEWDNRKEKDKETLSRLSGVPYEQVEEKLFVLASVVDAPVRLIENVWQVISKRDLWSLVCYKINRQSIERLENVILTVLGESDPSYDLAPAERWLANIKGAIPEYSTILKSGLADTLALLATFGDSECHNIGEIKPSNRVQYWVRELLNKDLSARSWYSFGETLKSLSEAAPESFLNALERSIEGHNPPIGLLFVEHGEFSGYTHANNIIWALETISWKLDYLPLVSRALCKLAEIDARGRYGNCPLNSLKEIYLGWINNTRATHMERLQIIDSNLIKFHPKVVWELLILLLPDVLGEFSSPINKPIYSNWAENVKKEVMKKDYDQYSESVANMLLNLVSEDPESRWPDLAENITRLPKKQLNEAIEKLISIDRNELNNETRLEIADKLRAIISQHREFEETKWASPKCIIDKLEEAYNFIVPDSIVLKSKYLFDVYYPNLINPLISCEKHTQEYNEIIELYRKDELLKIYQILGIKGIKQLITSCNFPKIAGKTIANLELRNNVESELLNWLESEDALKAASQSFILSCAIADRNWVKVVFDQSKNWSEDKIVNFLSGLPFNKDTFDILSQLDGKITEKYWREINSFNLVGRDLGKINWVLEQLLLYGRPIEALSVASNFFYDSNPSVSLDCRLLADILQKIAVNPGDYENKTISQVQNDILEAIEYVQKQKQLPEKEIIQIEWIYLPLLRLNSFKPKYLEEEILNNAEFFSLLVSFVFKSNKDKKEKENVDEKTEKFRAKNALMLLNLVSSIPGQREDCTIDVEKLREWVHKARGHLELMGMMEVGDYQIGKVLSNSPTGSDNIWPHESVRDLIEELQNPDLENAIKIEKMNSRGATTRFVFDGGKQEKEIAEKYSVQAETIKLRWSRTSEVLRSLKRSYDSDASKYDSEVELIK